MDAQTEDISLGKGAWIYCDQHLRPHKTGWCTVGLSHKRKLDIPNDADHAAAYAECFRLGLEIFDHKPTK